MLQLILQQWSCEVLQPFKVEKQFKNKCGSQDWKFCISRFGNYTMYCSVHNITVLPESPSGFIVPPKTILYSPKLFASLWSLNCSNFLKLLRLNVKVKHLLTQDTWTFHDKNAKPDHSAC